MQSFKEYLKESNNYQALMLQDAVKALKDHCSNSLQSGNIQHFYRGSDSDSSIPRYSIVTSGGERRSKNFYDYYNIMIDDSSAARSMNMPRRKQSIIMATNSVLAEYYGKVYCVVPFNGTKIAVSDMKDVASDDKFDVGDSATSDTMSMTQFDASFWSNLNPNGTTKSAENRESINQILNKLKAKDPSAIAIFHKYFPESTNDPVKTILDAYNRFVNQHIKVYEAGNVPQSAFRSSSEAWFNGSAVMFEKENLKYVKDALKKSS